jgi:hypothetical protein
MTEYINILNIIQDSLAARIVQVRNICFWLRLFVEFSFLNGESMWKHYIRRIKWWLRL